MPKTNFVMPTVFRRPNRRTRPNLDKQPEAHSTRKSQIDAELRRTIEENKQRGSPRHGH